MSDLCGQLPEDLEDRVRDMYRYSEVGKCVSSVTHDVNNLLGAIMAYAELVGLESGLSTEATRMLQEIIGAVKKSSTLINNLTDVARKQRPDVRIIDLSALVDRALDLRRYDVRIGHMEATLDVEASLPSIPADLPKLQRAFMYIFTNAIEALESTESKEIRVSVRRAPQDADEPVQLEVAVWDSGPGVPETDHERIFEPFYCTKGTGHVGLGLTAARATAELHEGTLRYDPDFGFVMRLPVANSLSDQV
ncbi:MAG: HAMP domain-containing histidine kinase [bacterium]|nr:HAMP domain-containing histidine kinase [bacterium]